MVQLKISRLITCQCPYKCVPYAFHKRGEGIESEVVDCSSIIRCWVLSPQSKNTSSTSRRKFNCGIWFRGHSEFTVGIPEYG